MSAIRSLIGLIIFCQVEAQDIVEPIKLCYAQNSHICSTLAKLEKTIDDLQNRLKIMESEVNNDQGKMGVIQDDAAVTSGNLGLGTEFFMEIIGYKSNPKIVLTFQSEQDGEIQLQTLATRLSVNVTFSAGSNDLNVVSLLGVSHRLYLYDTLHCISSVPISLIYYGEQGDTYSVWPVRSLGTKYLIPSYAGEATLEIVSVKENTRVNVLFRNGSEILLQSLTMKYLENRTFTGYNISGSTVSSDKPVAVFSHQFTEIPSGSSYADHIGEQCMDTSYFGTRYLITPFRQRKGYLYRVFANENATSVSIFRQTGELEESIWINVGGHIERVLYEPLITIIISDKPVLTTVFAKSRLEDHAGEPTMTSIPAIDRMFPGEAKLRTPVSDFYHSNYMTIVARERYIPGSLKVNSDLAVDMTGTEMTMVLIADVPYTVYSLILTEQNYILQHPESSTPFYAIAYGFRVEGKAEGYSFSVIRG